MTAIDSTDSADRSERSDSLATAPLQAYRQGLWAITAGQRLRYSGAIAALGVANLFMFGGPLIGKYALDNIQGLPLTGAGSALDALAGSIAAALAASPVFVGATHAAADNAQVTAGAQLTASDVKKAVAYAKVHMVAKYDLDNNGLSTDEIAKMSLTGKRAVDLAKALKESAPPLME